MGRSGLFFNFFHIIIKKKSVLHVLNNGYLISNTLSSLPIKLKVVVIPSYVILTVGGNLFRIFKSFIKSFTWKRGKVD
jgi:hypothetical protein